MKGWVAIVTGAAMGVGEETAQLFAPAGAKVVLADFNVEAGEKVAQSLVEAVGKAAFSRIGLSNSDHVKLMVVFAVERFGRLDATVNNATLGPDNSPAAVLDEACWETAGEGCLSGPSPPPLALAKAFSRSGSGRIFPLFSRVMPEGL